MLRKLKKFSLSKWWQHKVLSSWATPTTRTELESILTRSADKGIVPREIYKIMYFASQSSDKRVRDIMVPRTHMSVIKQKDTLQDWVQEIIKSKHSRYPVVAEELDNVIGMLLPKDLLPYISRGAEIDEKQMKQLMRPAHFVPETQHLFSLMTNFRRQRSHMAIVVDEHGGTAGLVTLEDALEEIIGEIEDEHDIDQQDMVAQISENTWQVNALISTSEFNRYFKTNIRSTKIETIGGWMAQKLKHVPKLHDTVNLKPYQIKVTQAHNRRAEQLRVIRTVK